MGRQGQLITRTGGSGEFGLMNFGLNKQGMDIQGGKPYEGVLRVKSNGAESIFLSLRDSEGKILAEKEFPLAGDGSWEKVEFELTPSGSDPKGGFGIALRDNGEVELGYVYLQAGQWGYLVIFVIMGVCQYFSMQMPMIIAKKKAQEEAEKHHRKPADTTSSQNKMMQYYMLAMILVFGLMWPAAMSVYWTIYSIVTIVKTILVQKIIDKQKEGAK